MIHSERVRATNVADVLLSLVALSIGLAIGRLRGGSISAALATRLRRKGFLVVGIGASMIVNLLEPSQPLLWHSVSIVGFFVFAIANVAFTGMIVLLIGMLMNLAPLVANGSVPVSELALESVGVTNESGEPIIDGVRESKSTASRLSFLGDIVPVPVIDKVISLGDLVIYVALADVVMNVVLRRRRRDEPDADGDGVDSGDSDIEIDLRDIPVSTGPAHSAGTYKLTPPLPRVRRPVHAAEPLVTSPTKTAFDRQPPPPTGDPIPGPPPIRHNPASIRLPRRTRSARPSGRSILESREPTIDLTDGETPPQIDLTDRRPIIDLTISPTDDQLAEFLRRRAVADERLHADRLGPPSPGHRRNRRRRSRVPADSKS